MNRRDLLRTYLAGGVGIMVGGLGQTPEAHALSLKDLQELDKLDYFEKNAAGEIVLAAGVCDQVIDFHTHIGLSFLGMAPLDLDREDPEALTFFPARGNPVDFERYSAWSFNEENHKVTSNESVKQAFTKKGYAGTHTPKNLLNEMDRNRVTHSVILAIDLMPAFRSKNTEVFLEASRRFPRLITFMSVYPGDPQMEAKVRKYKAAGAVGMKLHPPMQFLRANEPECMKLTKLCGELGLPCLFHAGSSPIAPKFQEDYPRVAHFWKPVREQPETTFILAHGAIDQYRELIELAVKHENVLIELSGQPHGHMREMIDAGLEDRMFYGSDWPYYGESWPLAQVFLATEDNLAAREKIAYGNAKKFLTELGCQGV